jgi:hypothetical protein
MFSVLNKIFNKFNFNKFLILFMVGFVSRVLVGYIYNINVYLDSLSSVFIVYYICMSVFVVLVHEFVDYFSFSFSFSNIIYTSLIEFIVYIVRMQGLMNFRVFSIRLGDIKLSSIIKGANNRTIDSKSIKIFSVLDRNDEIKPYGKTRFGNKGSYRPVISSPLSNPPITPANINEIKPTRENIFSGKTNSSLRPENINHRAGSGNASALDLINKALKLKNDEYITKYKDEFKEFYTTYRKSIKLSDYQLESLSIKIAEAYHKGKYISNLFPDRDHTYLYDKFLSEKE